MPSDRALTAAEKALYFTYATGMREKYDYACGTDLQATPVYTPGLEPVSATLNRGVLADRNATHYESCYFIFKTERGRWKQGQMHVKIEHSSGVDLYMFKGEDRTNAT